MDGQETMKRWISLGFLLLWPTLLLAQGASVSSIPTFGINLTPPDTDLSLIYLSNMFGVVDGVLYGTGSQLLGTLFGVFNSAVLVLGGIIILYTFFIGTLRTAHEGEALGKEWSSIWIPLRTVFGIALLIPKASGYSFIQILVMWIIVRGIGAADSMWNTALDYLYSGGIVISQNYSGNGAVDTTPMVNFSTKLLRSLTCVEMLQAEISRYRMYQIQKNISPLDPAPSFQSDIIRAINSSTSSTRPVLLPTSNYYGTNGVCGSITWKDVAEQLPSQLQKDSAFMAAWQGDKSRTVAVSTTVAAVFPTADAIVNNYLIHTINPAAGIPLGQLNNGKWGGPPPNTGSYLIQGTALSDAAASYYGLMTTTMRLIAQAANNTDSKTAWTQAAKIKGWALAGAYYFDIVNANEQVSSVVDQNIPEFSQDMDSDLTSVGGITNYLGGSTSPFVIQLNTLLNGTGKNNNFIVSEGSRFINDLAQNAGVQSYGSSNVGGGAAGSKAASAAGGVSKSMGGFLGGLGNSEQSNLNPVVGIAVYGDYLVNMSFIVILVLMLVGFGITIGLGAIPFCSVGAAGVSIVTAITSFLVPIFMSIIVIGLTMAYYIPMIPFIIFSFGVIGWFIAVVEAILAAPLVALGISHPEGNHPILGKADPAVALLVNVFLRPTFMIFGLLLGMMVSYVGLWLVNQGFGYAFSQATATASDPFKPIACVVIYVMIVLQILQKGFSLIYTIPDQVLRWIGMNVQSMGGEAEAERSIGEGVKSGFTEVGNTAGAAGKLGAELGGGSGSEAGGVGGMIKGGIEASASAKPGSADGVKKEGEGAESAAEGAGDGGDVKAASAGTSGSVAGGSTPAPPV
jgi:defect-in-organelle-trafficking protein DotA